MHMNRRGFIGGMLAAGTGPILLPGCANMFVANSKVNIGVIGYGRIAHTMDVPATIRFTDLCRFVAVCDLDQRRREYGAEQIKEHYRKLTGEQDAPVKTYADYRDLLADPEIDAVMLCIPDHWHAIVATDAVLAGKHIYLQKPFTQTIEEGRILRDLAMKKGTVLQVGSWQRSVRQFALVCELVQNGRIGEVKRVEVGCGCDKEGGSSAVQPVPAGFDYDTWLGPTDGNAPYNETRCHTQDLKKIGNRPGWIQLEPYGWDMITNWGAHQIDIAQWGLNKDDSGPESVSGTCEWMKTDGGKLWNVHTKYDLHYSYNGGKTDVHVCNKYPMGIKFIGEKGDWLYCMRGTAKVTPSDPDVPGNGKMQALMASKNKLLEPIADPQFKVHTSDNHFLNWLEAIRLDDPEHTVTNVWTAQRSATACNLGYMCMKLGKTIEWDAKTETSRTAGTAALMKPFARGKFNMDRAIAAL